MAKTVICIHCSTRGSGQDSYMARGMHNLGQGYSLYLPLYMSFDGTSADVLHG